VHNPILSEEGSDGGEDENSHISGEKVLEKRDVWLPFEVRIISWVCSIL
jgi:hypothetical protein